MKRVLLVCALLVSLGLLAASFPVVNTSRIVMGGSWILESSWPLWTLKTFEPTAAAVDFIECNSSTGFCTMNPLPGQMDSAPTLTGDVSDWTEVCGTTWGWSIASDADRSIDGLDCDAIQDSQRLYLYNTGGFNITLVDEGSSSSDPENRFRLGGSDRILAPNDGIEIVYDNDAQKYRAIDRVIDAGLSASDLSELNTALGSNIADGPHTTDTNANTICTGTTTYLDGDGGCDDLSSVYQPLATDLTRLVANCELEDDATPIPDSCVGDGTDSGAGGDPIDAWPVGSVFISVVSTNPNTLLGGGTWSAFGTGRVLVGIDGGDTDFDTVEETGGSKTHTLTEAEMPAHIHDEIAPTTASGGAMRFAVDTNASGTVDSTLDTGSTGGGTAHPIVQPYIVVYMWKRTA